VAGAPYVMAGPGRDQAGHDDRSDRLAVQQEAIENCLEVLDGGGVDLDQKAVFPRDAATLRDLGLPDCYEGAIGCLVKRLCGRTGVW
jgi:hypothetical protein